MTSQQFLVNDNSTVANFKAWASALSNFIRTAGWTNSSDTGQLNGAGGGNWAGVSSVPGSGAFYYEIFKPGDGLQTFYLKIEYGNASGTNAPSIAITVGGSTDGAGNLTGTTTVRVLTMAGTYISTPSSVATFECDFCGDPGKLAILMWRNATDQRATQVFAIQRSLDSSGNPYGTSTTGYVTVWTVGGYSGAPTNNGFQQSYVFGIGPAPALPGRPTSASYAGWAALPCLFGYAGSSAFAGGIPISHPSPCVGKWDSVCTVVGAAYAGDITEGVPFSITNQYGQTKTYMPSKNGNLPTAVYGGGAAVCVEYD